MLQGCFLLINAKENDLKSLIGEITLDISNNPDVIKIESGEPTLGIEIVRQLQTQLALKPSLISQKIVIIHEAGKLTPQAQNALLKTLEEPPGNAVIFLLATSSDFFLPTVLSRCQIIRYSSGSQDQNSLKLSKIHDLLECLPQKSSGERLKLASDHSSNREETIQFLDALLITLHLNLIQMDEHTQTREIEAVFEAKKYLEANCNVRLTIENLFLNW